MRKVILASHSRLASGMKDTIEMITGNQENLIAYNGYVDGNTDISVFLSPLIESGDEIVVITDLLGGSINKEAVQFLKFSNVRVISGMNVALVLEIICDTTTDLDQLLENSINNCKDMISLMKKEDFIYEDEDF